MCGPALRLMLTKNGLTPEKLHIALLHLRIAEQEREIQRAYSAAKV
jgi:hypothetical protein